MESGSSQRIATKATKQRKGVSQCPYASSSSALRAQARERRHEPSRSASGSPPSRAGDELGRLADSYTSRGELVPDDVTDRMVAARLSEEDVARGFLLDGYPRNLHQVHALDDILGGLGTALDFVLEITADDDVVVQRLLGRAADEGRKDDTEDVIRHRIALYHQTTEPLIAEYRARRILLSVDGIGEVDEVAERIGRAVDSFLSSRA